MSIGSALDDSRNLAGWLGLAGGGLGAYFSGPIGSMVGQGIGSFTGGIVSQLFPASEVYDRKHVENWARNLGAVTSQTRVNQRALNQLAWTNKSNRQ